MQHSKNSFSRKLTLSYVIVFLIPLLLSAVVYTTAATYIHQYSEKMLESELRGNERFVQDLLTEFNNAYVDLSANQTVRTALAGGPLSPSQYVSLQTQLGLISSQTGGLFNDIVVYFGSSEYAVGLFSGDSADNYYESVSGTFYESQEDWKAMMSTYHPGNLIKTRDGIFYLKSISESTGPSAVTLGISIPASRLAELNDSIKLYGETNLILLDEHDQVVFQSRDSLAGSSGVEELLGEVPEHESRKITRGGIHYIANHSSFYHFDYLILVKEDRIVASLKLLLLIILSVTSASFFLGGVVIRRFVINRTKPVQDILDLLGSSSGDGGELELIQQGVARNLHHIMRSRPFLVDSFISSIISGKYDGSVPLDFSHPNFQFILLRAGDMGIYKPEDGDDASKLSGLMYTAIINIFDELLTEIGDMYHSLQGETLVFLLNTETEARADDVEHAYRQVNDYLNVDAFVVLSEACPDLKQLQLLWKDTIRRLDNAEMRGRTGVESGGSAPAASSGGGYQKYINLFTTAILAGDKSEAQNAVREMIQTCAENHKNMNDVKFNLLTMMNDAARELERTAQVDVKSKLYESNAAYKVIEAKSTAMLLEITDSFLAMVGGLPGAQQQAQLEERVAAYIRSHFNDKNLNLKIIADKFHMTPAYLSQKFKAHFGSGILDYLSGIRLEHAKTKLLETDWSLERISDCCGYTNTVTFSRQFKSYTGVTPGRFRQTHESPQP